MTTNPPRLGNTTTKTQSFYVMKTNQCSFTKSITNQHMFSNTTTNPHNCYVIIVSKIKEFTEVQQQFLLI